MDEYNEFGKDLVRECYYKVWIHLKGRARFALAL